MRWRAEAPRVRELAPAIEGLRRRREHLDNEGNVVSRTVTTEQGNYRFQNVDHGNYQVRVRRHGFRAVSQAVEARASAPAAAARPMQLQLH